MVDPPHPGAGVRRALGVLALMLAAPLAWANGDDTTVIVVVGAGGSKEWQAAFVTAADHWKAACTKAGARFIAIGLAAEGGAPDRQRLQEILAREGGRGSGELWLALIGHGTFDGRSARFNLRGSDVSDKELADWIKPVRRPLVVLNGASASAPFLKTLAGPGRVIVTATKSGGEQNVARFGTFLAEEIASPAADLDKDGQTSLLEAFVVTARRVEAFYGDAGRLATEHALIDDNGDGFGTPAGWFRALRPDKKPAGDASPDGARAHQIHLVRSDVENQLPADLRRRRDDLELKVGKLRETKDALPESDYYARLEPLLLELARIYERAPKK